MKLKQRILAIIICLAMSVSVLPFSAFAETADTSLPEVITSETAEAAPITEEEEPRVEPSQIITLIDATNFKIVDENIAVIHNVNQPATLLFDKQEEIPALPYVKGSKIQGSNWKPAWDGKWGVASCYIDLGAEFYISTIGYMDTNGISQWSLEYGTPFNWQTAATWSTDQYLSWRYVSLGDGVITRYIRLTSSFADSGINEIGLYGYKVADADTSQDSNVRQPVTAPLNLTSGQRIGACGFCDDPYTALDVLGNLRDYYNSSWVVNKSGTGFDFNGIVNRDKFYTKLADMGITTIPCVQLAPECFTEEGENYNDIRTNKPLVNGSDATDPASYQLHGRLMYNLAARYGSNVVDASTLMTSDKVTGLNLLRVIESWNEENANWASRDTYFTPYEYAAMLSADWDGDEGKIQNAGVKTADPNMMLSMGGLAGSGVGAIEYLSLMKHWFDYNRTDGEFCADIINVHEYISDTEAPENSNYRTNLQNLVAWIEANVPGRDLWLSEFDVKTTDKEVSGVDNHDNEEYAKARAERLIRAFLVAEREGVDISSMFMLRDEWTGVYGNSGLTTGKGQWDKKASWYYVSCATDVLKNADLVSFEETDSVYKYTYLDRETGETIYAVWSPTADGSTVEGYALSVGDSESIIAITPDEDTKYGSKEALPVSSDTVSITVTETPVFVRVKPAGTAENYPTEIIGINALRVGKDHGSIGTIFYDNETILNIGAGETITAIEDEYNSQFMLSQFYKMFDEQSEGTTPQVPWAKAGSAPVTNWHAPKTSTAKRVHFPYSCIVTFDDYYDIDYIGLYDSNGTGKLEVYNDETDELIFTSDLGAYNIWSMKQLSNTAGKAVNRVRIVKYDTANLNELAFYGYKTYSKVGKDVDAVPGDIYVELETGLSKKEVVNWELSEASKATIASKYIKSATDNLSKLFDEQGIVPVNTEHTVNNGQNPFKTKCGNIYNVKYPLECVVSFDGVQTISKVALMNEWGNASGSITIKDMDGNDLGTYKFGEKNRWFVFDLPEPVQADKIIVIKNDNATISEIAFY